MQQDHQVSPARTCNHSHGLKADPSTLRRSLEHLLDGAGWVHARASSKSCSIATHAVPRAVPAGEFPTRRPIDVDMGCEQPCLEEGQRQVRGDGGEFEPRHSPDRQDDNALNRPLHFRKLELPRRHTYTRAVHQPRLLQVSRHQNN